MAINDGINGAMSDTAFICAPDGSTYYAAVLGRLEGMTEDGNPTAVLVVAGVNIDDPTEAVTGLVPEHSTVYHLIGEQIA